MTHTSDHEYCVFLVSICGYPKKRHAELASKQGWRKASKAEREQYDREWVKI